MNRETLRGTVIWLTGIPASGKSTIASEVVRRLWLLGVCHVWLDSDRLRSVMTPTPSYTDDERAILYATLAHLGERGTEGGATVLISATGNLRRYRDAARAKVSSFCEVHVKCDPEAARQRDPKGLYAAQTAGLPGAGGVYEAPLRPELTIDTTYVGPEAAATEIVSWLKQHVTK